ncbi:MAG: LLM class F420-dependent oxidoreductase [Candidatus Rokuibacteriota bacterium]|nr:MAG: LLM class F420-dependent oxidoreductase [Candidatus Rokubacteria bacterium]
MIPYPPSRSRNLPFSRRSVVEFGLSLPGRGPLAGLDVVLKIAEKADSLRYGSLFVTDHVVMPVSSAKSVYPYTTSGQFPGGLAQDYLEPLVLLSHLAHATTRVRLGVSVLVVPYRNPLVAAKMLATTDVLSKGRVVLGAGVGWLREEFEALGAPPFEERGSVTDEYLKLMRAAWTTDPVTFEGKYYTIRDIHVLPKPVQRPAIPIWIGGHTDAALRRAGTIGDGWHPIGMRPPALLVPDEYAAKVKQIHTWARRAGRDPSSITLTIRVPMEVRGKRARAAAGDRPLFQGTADEVVADIRRYQALGVSHFVFDHTVQELRAVLANMERFANDVRPKVARARRK